MNISNMTTTIGEITDPVQSILLWLIDATAQGLPKLIAALLILLAGWIVATLVAKITEKVLSQLKIDRKLKERGIQQAIFNISIENASVTAVKWYIYFLFFEQAVLTLGLIALANFFDAIIIAVPQIIVGVAVLILSLVLASWLKEQIVKTKVEIAEILGTLVYGFIVYIGVVLALPKFGFEQTDILLEAFRLFVGGLALGVALAIGIGFGLAIKEGPAKKVLKDMLASKKRKR